MSIFEKNLALPKTLEDYTEARNKARTMIESHYESSRRIDSYLKQIGNYLYVDISPRQSLDLTLKQLDMRFWKLAFDATRFSLLMDDDAKKEFDRDLENKTPDFTVENCTATFLALHQEAEMMFKRGIVNTFRRLSGGYVTNSKEPFTIGKKSILSYMISMWYGYPQIQYNQEQRVNDIDRVVKVVLGKPFEPRALESAMNNAFKNGENYDDEFYHAKAFKNGNLHLTIKSDGALEKINELIAEYYGENKLAA